MTSDAREATPTEAVEHFVPLASRDMNLESKERNRLMPQLLSSMDRVFHVMENGRTMLKRY